MSPTAANAIRLHRRAKNQEAWGFVLLAISGALWLWFAVLLLLPYDAGGTTCESRLFTDAPTAHTKASYRNPCAAERDWPELLGVIGFSVPTSVIGGILHISGTLTIRLADRAAAETPTAADDDAS